MTTNEILKKLNGVDITIVNTLNRAIIAYSLGMDEVTPEQDEKLDEVLSYYLENDTINSLLDEQLFSYAQERLQIDNL
jgi:hypothetical protein